MDAARIAASLDRPARRALRHREGAAEACMSWDTARQLFDAGLTERDTRYLSRLTSLGQEVRAALLP